MDTDKREQGKRGATSVRLGLAGAGLAVALAVTGVGALGGVGAHSTTSSATAAHAVSAGS